MGMWHHVHSEVLALLLPLAQVVVLSAIELPRILVVNDLVLGSIEVSDTLVLVQSYFVSMNNCTFSWSELVERHGLRLLFLSWLWLIMRRWCNERREFRLLLLTHRLFVVLLIKWEGILNIRF